MDKKTAMVTGANVGIGKEVARQLGASGKYGRVYLACRDGEKAEAARRELAEATGKAIFEVILLDLSSVAAVRAAVGAFDDSINDLVMNAGGAGGPTPLALTKDGVTEIFAANVLGHVVLLESLMTAKRLTRCAVLAGSEAARGVPALGMKRPAVATGSVDEFAALCDGSYFRDKKADGALAYGQVKYVGALWMAALARRTEGLRLITMSPGNTRGTEIGRDYPAVLRLVMKTVLMNIVFPMKGMVHDVGDGAGRLIRGVNDAGLRSGGFYGSEAGKLTGRVVEQGEIFGDLGNEGYQENALAAVRRFV